MSKLSNRYIGKDTSISDMCRLSGSPKWYLDLKSTTLKTWTANWSYDQAHFEKKWKTIICMLVWSLRNRKNKHTQSASVRKILNIFSSKVVSPNKKMLKFCKVGSNKETFRRVLKMTFQTIFVRSDLSYSDMPEKDPFWATFIAI